jgi:hypothetical protein
MRVVIVPAAVILAALTAAATVSAQQTCLRPKWTECVSFPNGGLHTGVSIQGAHIQTDVTPGPDICVTNEEEIGGRTYARFTRDNAPWPNRDWGVNVDDFCFYKK